MAERCRGRVATERKGGASTASPPKFRNPSILQVRNRRQCVGVPIINDTVRQCKKFRDVKLRFQSCKRIDIRGFILNVIIACFDPGARVVLVRAVRRERLSVRRSVCNRCSACERRESFWRVHLYSLISRWLVGMSGV
ncbi:UNVERIFIED_CONTAM: hypothetical protein Slati_0875700 [Sesamum latifolium]|uniref:Uncharacterized protein n=1 Tax=Sesamum latifolium TaxID=2727402 RepID=A0AAW2XMU3_9LAMI